MLISYTELCELVRDGVIDADPANINGASIDIRIGPELMLERCLFGATPVVDLRRRVGKTLRPPAINSHGLAPSG